MTGGSIGPGFHFIGERLCIDFVNTEVMAGASRVDLLGGFDDLLAWCVAAQVVSGARASEMRQRWGSGRDAERTFARALELRASLRDLVQRLTAGQKKVSQAALDALNEVLRTQPGELEIVRRKAGYELRFRPAFDDPADLLVPIAKSAADLLSTDDLSLVRKCQSPLCLLYFYDTTKNHARRWCSMAACGNRAKAAAHYRRARQQAS